MTRNLRVVVAVPTLNEAAMIESVLATLALARSEVPDVQIVVVDGGSTDGTQDRVRRAAREMPFVHLASRSVGNIGAAINLVAREWALRADVLVRCDAHAHYPRRFVQPLLEALQRTGAASVVVPMDSVGRGCFQKAVAWVSDTLIGSGGAAHRGGRRSGFVDHGHHAAFRLERFLALGGYDEGFTCNEDAELDCRLRAAGGAIYLDAAIRIQYYPRANPRALWRQYFNYGKGRCRTMRRHPHAIRLRQLAVPGHLIAVILFLAAAAMTGQWPWLAWPLTYLALLAGTSLIMAIRKRSLCGFLAGPAAGIMHTAWACGLLLALGSKPARAPVTLGVSNRPEQV